jgi:uncharacterized repeat protein (TIGR01451 family)
MFTLSVTNYGPSGSTNVVVTDTLPTGTTLVSTTPSLGTVTNNGAGLLTWTIPSLAKDAFATLALELQANAVGRITNVAVVASGATDLNPDNDTASAVASIVASSADLALSLVGAPSPVSLGDYLTYTITVSNGGPATATAVTLVDKLPSGVVFVSAAPAGYTVSGQTVTFTNLGDLGSDATTTATIVVQPTVLDTITDTASCSSTVTDPLKGNNAASVKTVVQAISMTVARVGDYLEISWPASAGTYILESTTNLAPPSVWTPVTDAVPALVGGRTTVLVPITSGDRFFRLRFSTVPTVALSISRAGDNVILAWPINPWNFSLESATDLRPPVAWSPVTSPAPSTDGGKNTVTLPIGNGSKLFRLRAQ